MRKIASAMLVLVILLVGCAGGFAEESEGFAPKYDIKAAKIVAKQAITLLEAGNYKEARNFLLAFYSQFAEDNDINFLLGQANGMMGSYSEAIHYYKKILAGDPNLPRVRLELGRVYAANGQAREARQEFNSVLASSPPPVVAQHVKKFLEQMDAQKNLSVRVTMGYLFDSNVNAGPDNVIVNNGWQYNTVKHSDHGVTLGMQADYFRQMGADTAWQFGMQYNRTDYRNETDLSWDDFTVSTGLLKRYANATYSLPVYAKLVNVGGQRFSYSYGITPQAQFTLPGDKELMVSINGQTRQYTTNENRNGSAWSLNVAERFNLNKEKNRFWEIGGGFGRENARWDCFADRNVNVYATYYTPLPKGFSLLIRPSITWYTYLGEDGYSQLVGSPACRNERQVGLQFNLIKTQGSWNYIFGYTYTRNYSNIDIYNYNRSLISMQIAKYF